MGIFIEDRTLQPPAIGLAFIGGALVFGLMAAGVSSVAARNAAERPVPGRYAAMPGGADGGSMVLDTATGRVRTCGTPAAGPPSCGEWSTN